MEEALTYSTRTPEMVERGRRVWLLLCRDHAPLLSRDNFRGALVLAQWLHQCPAWGGPKELRQLWWTVNRFQQMFYFMQYDGATYYQMTLEAQHRLATVMLIELVNEELARAP